MNRGSGAGGVSVLAASYVPVSCPADATEDTLATITIPPNTLGPNGMLRITTQWTFSGAGGSKTMRVRFDGAAGSQYLNASAAAARTNGIMVTIICNANATNAQVGQSYGVEDTGVIPAFNNTTSAADTTGATSAVITGQKAAAGDVCTLVGFTAEVIR